MTENFLVKKSFFGRTQANEQVECYRLKNQLGMEVCILNYGGIITSLKVPNKEGKFENVVLGYDSMDSYIKDSPYFGAIVGRFANRIAKGNFTLEGKSFNLNTNLGLTHLHGGIKGFDKVLWNASIKKGENSVSLVLTYMSPHMEEGYPGNLLTTVTYQLTEGNALEVHYTATTDQTTVVNLTQHSYFNLSGDFSKTVLDHQVQLYANHYLPVDENLIPIGSMASVSNSPFDFRTYKTIGDDIDKEHPQLRLGSGYDHCWVLSNSKKLIKPIATVIEPHSGRRLDIHTDQPGVQFYTANGLEGAFKPRTAFCLETQHFPDSPNQSLFPTTILRPKEKYQTTTIFKFSVNK